MPTDFGVDRARIVVAGESGGGNLSIATVLRLKRDGALDIVKGLYAFCPYINGSWPDPRYPSSFEYRELLSDVTCNRGRIGYGIEAFDARDPLAWPGFATREDVTGFPPTVVSVNECDPLRDEGVAFYRLLLSAGVEARALEALGTMHATEMYPTICPEISRATARDLARSPRSNRTERRRGAGTISLTDTHRRSATERSIAEQIAATLAPTAKSGLQARSDHVAARSAT